MVDIKCVPARTLGTGQLQAWREIQGSNPCLASPYFCPEFTLAVSRVCRDTRVAVFAAAGKSVGFFPFHKRSFGTALPVGSILSDFHGAIVEPDVTWTWNQLIRACRIPGFDFHHLIDSQLPQENYSAKACISPYINLHDGFDEYVQQHRESTRELTQTLRKARKASRETGPVRFVFQSTDPGVWEALVQWKTSQYQRDSATNAFAYEWSYELLQNLSRTTEPGFKGILSALYFDDRLVAVHFGMMTGQVLHWWFPAYDPSLRKYSPGLILLLETARTAAQQGIERIDLGKGEERYKLSFMTGSQTVYEGSVDCNAFLHTVRVNYASTRQWLLSTPVGPVARSVVNALRSVRPNGPGR